MWVLQLQFCGMRGSEVLSFFRLKRPKKFRSLSWIKPFLYLYWNQCFFFAFSSSHNSWFQIHERWGHQQIIAHLLSPSVWTVSTEADSQRTIEAQVHHAIHQEDGLPDRADRSLPPLEVRGPRGGIQLRWLRYVSSARTPPFTKYFPQEITLVTLILSDAEFWQRFPSQTGF